MPPSLEMIDSEATPPSLTFSGSEVMALSLGMTDVATPTSTERKQKGHVLFTRTET